jgi:hypothetical protein
MSGSRANPVEIKDDNTIEISDDENDVEVIDLLGTSVARPKANMKLT